MSGSDFRTTTAIRFSSDLHDRLRATAQEYGWSVNWIVNRAVTEFLRDLLPPDEIRLTRHGGTPAHQNPTPPAHGDQRLWTDVAHH